MKGDTSKMRVDHDVNGDLVIVRMHGGASNPPLVGVPAIDWDFTFMFDFSGSRPTYLFAGAHDGFPAYEVYLNDQQVWAYDPGPPICEVRITRSGADLIAPLMVYCPEQVENLFPFLDVMAVPHSGIVPLPVR